MSKQFLAGLIGAAGVFAATVASGQGVPKTYPDVLKCAQGETGLQIWSIDPATPEAKTALIDAFVKRFGLKSKPEWLSINSGQSTPRLIAESKVGKVAVDVVGSDSTQGVLDLKNAGVLKPYPYEEVFGKELPGVVEAARTALPDFNGYALNYYDVVFGLVFNTNLVKEADLPKRLSDFTNEAWKARFGLNAFFLIPLDVAAAGLGKDATLELARKLIANQPVLQRGSPAVASAVSSGAVPVGMTGYNFAQNLINRKEPVGFKLFDDVVPVSPLYIYAPENSPNPCSARLFVAWMATEGLPIATRFDPLPRIADSTSGLGKQVADKVKGGAKLALPESVEQVQLGVDIRKAIQGLLTK